MSLINLYIFILYKNKTVLKFIWLFFISFVNSKSSFFPGIIIISIVMLILQTFFFYFYMYKLHLLYLPCLHDDILFKIVYLVHYHRSISMNFVIFLLLFVHILISLDKNKILTHVQSCFTFVTLFLLQIEKHA